MRILTLAPRCAVVLAMLAAARAYAQTPPDASVRPPATVSGFRHQLLQQRVHMNICEAATCTPESKVSYLFLPHNPSPSFERFRAERAMIAAALRKWAAPGTTTTFARSSGPRTRSSPSSRPTAWKPMRTERVFFLNWRFHRAHMTAEIISSSTSREAAEQNLALFAVPVMVLMQSKPGAGKNI